MRYFGNLHTPPHPVAPDSWLTVLLTAGTAQAFDWPTNCDLFRVSVGSTVASLGGPVFFNPSSTSAVVPTTSAVITSGTSAGIPINAADNIIFQRPRTSTGFSFVSGSSVSFCVEFWKRNASTST